MVRATSQLVFRPSRRLCKVHKSPVVVAVVAVALSFAAVAVVGFLVSVLLYFFLEKPFDLFASAQKSFHGPRILNVRKRGEKILFLL